MYISGCTERYRSQNRTTQMNSLQKTNGICIGGGCGFLSTQRVVQLRKKQKQRQMSLFLQQKKNNRVCNAAR